MRRILCAALLLLTVLPAWAAEWRIEHGASRLGFVATQQGGRFEGHFRQWQATMRFDPQRLDESLFDVRIDVASITTGSNDRDPYLPSKDWFFTKQFPTATFRTTGFSAKGGDDYVAQGVVTIRGVSQTIDLPFTWVVDGDQAKMHAETVLERTVFGVGQGEFAATDVVGRDVRVVVDLTLRR